MRPCAGRNQGFLEAQFFFIDRQHVGAGETCVAEEHVHAGRGQSLDRIAAAEVGTDTPHALHHGGEVDRDIARYLCAIACCVAHFGIQPRCADDRFRRYATDIETRRRRSVGVRSAQPWRRARRRLRRPPDLPDRHRQSPGDSSLRAWGCATRRVQIGKTFALMRILRCGWR